MDQPAQKPGELVCGVDRDIVERALSLIRDNYRKADEACFFLEERAGINNLQAITNLRDAISHLVTLLDVNLSAEKRIAQLANAEEHLRRAIIEPYEIAIDSLIKDFYPLFLNYKEYLLPVQSRYRSLNSAPNSVSIEARVRDIHKLIIKGRSGKGKNLWDSSWEEGVTAFIDAFDKLTVLKAEIEGHWFTFEQLRRDRKQTLLAWWSIITTITTFVLAALLTYVLAK